MVIGLRVVQFGLYNHARDKQIGLPLHARSSDFVITHMIADRIGLHSVLLPINHKNYNFREKKNSQLM